MNREDFRSREATAAFLAFAALITLIALTPLAQLLIWFLPIPLIAFDALGSRWMPPILAALATASLLLVGFNWMALLLGLCVYFISWVMGQSIRRVESPHLPLITGTFVFIMLELVLLAFFRFNGIDINAALSQMVQTYLTQNPALLHAANGQSVRQLTDAMLQQVHVAFPAGLTISAFFLALANLYGARALMGRRAVDRLPVLLTWRLPYSVAVAYVISLAFVLFGWLQHQPFWWQIVNSVSLLAGFFIAIQGLAWIWRRIHHVRGAYGWMWLVVILSLLLNVVGGWVIIGNVLILIGLVDLINSSRRL